MDLRKSTQTQPLSIELKFVNKKIFMDKKVHNTSLSTPKKVKNIKHIPLSST